MPFNDEAVIRAAASCRIPLISAVGHETDTTLIDFVADCRAPTPTAAAEMAIPARADLLADLHQRSARLIGALNRLAQERRLRLERAERGLPDLPGFIGGARQRLDDRAERLALALPNLLAARRAALSRAERAIPDLPGMLAAAHQRLADRALRLIFALPNLLAMRRSEMERLGRLPASGATHWRPGSCAASDRGSSDERIAPRPFGYAAALRPNACTLYRRTLAWCAAGGARPAGRRRCTPRICVAGGGAQAGLRAGVRSRGPSCDACSGRAARRGSAPPLFRWRGAGRRRERQELPPGQAPFVEEIRSRERHMKLNGSTLLRRERFPYRIGSPRQGWPDGVPSHCLRFARSA